MAKRSSSSKKGPAGKPLGPDCRVVLLRGKEAFLRAQHTTGFKEKLADAVEAFDVNGDGLVDPCEFVLAMSHSRDGDGV